MKNKPWLVLSEDAIWGFYSDFTTASENAEWLARCNPSTVYPVYTLVNEVVGLTVTQWSQPWVNEEEAE